MDRIILGKDTENDKDFYLKVPEIITGRTAVIAKTGYGKSWTIRRISEQLLERGYPLGIIDPEGEHVSLADLYDMLIISPEGDVDLSKGSPKKLAKAAIEGVSFILDLSKYEAEIGAILTSEIIEALLKEGGKGFLVVVDEARELAPERGARSILGQHANLTSTWITTLATRGRKRGIGILFSTQRPQLISKTLLSQVENKIILRVEYNADISVISKFLGLDKQTVRKIRNLDKGVAFVEGPFADRPGFVKIGPVKSIHMGETPKPVPRPPPSLDEVIRYITSEPEVMIAISGSEDSKLKEEVIVEAKPSKVKKPVKRRISIRSPYIWQLPSKRLLSKPVKDLIAKRNELRSLIKRLESRKGEMRESVYELLREEYEKELKSLERDLEPYKREARETLLVLEAAMEDRRTRLAELVERKVNPLRRLINRYKMRKLRKEIERLEKRLKRTIHILDMLE
ncbi:MAG: DUF87 domain-containing protein [Candidatus Korarchaeota archaeon]|nr:DUF87 domain-containing protein [Candidatus Korarchaeota archaeon]